jgi:hypothetical protein
MVQLAGGVTAPQFRAVVVLVVPDAARPVGTEGTVAQELHAPTEVHGSPLPDGPLLVEGLLPCVHQLAT